MSRFLSAVLMAGLVLGTSVMKANATSNDSDKTPIAAKSVYDFKVKSIDGKDVDLSRYRGDVLLIVNVASR